MDASFNLEDELFQPFTEDERLGIVGAGKTGPTISGTATVTSPSTVDYDADYEYDWTPGN